VAVANKTDSAEKTASRGNAAGKGVAPLSTVPYIGTWIAAYLHPVETIEAEKKNASLEKVIINAALIGVFVGIVSFIVQMLGALIIIGMGGGIAALGILFIASLFGLVLTVVLAPIFILIGSAIYFVLAKILGGKGGYMEQTLGLTLISGGCSVILAPLQVIGIIPLIGLVFSLAGFAVGLYGLYSDYRLIKAVHGLSTIKAVMVIAIPIIVLIVIVVIAVAAMGMALLGLGGLGGAYGPSGLY
jgi:hypothetical protein